MMRRGFQGKLPVKRVSHPVSKLEACSVTESMRAASTINPEPRDFGSCSSSLHGLRCMSQRLQFRAHTSEFWKPNLCSCSERVVMGPARVKNRKTPGLNPTAGLNPPWGVGKMALAGLRTSGFRIGGAYGVSQPRLRDGMNRSCRRP